MVEGGTAQDLATVKGSAATLSGVLSGNAIIDGDYGDFFYGRGVAGSIAFGHLPYSGVPDSYLKALPAGLYASYDFAMAHDSRILDQYGVTDGFTIGSPVWVSADAKRKGFLTFDGAALPASDIAAMQPATTAATGGTLYVDLRASDANADAATWVNNGTLGNFARTGMPTKTTVSNIPAVSFNGSNQAYTSAGNTPRRPPGKQRSHDRGLSLQPFLERRGVHGLLDLSRHDPQHHVVQLRQRFDLQRGYALGRRRGLGHPARRGRVAPSRLHLQRQCHRQSLPRRRPAHDHDLGRRARHLRHAARQYRPPARQFRRQQLLEIFQRLSQRRSRPRRRAHGRADRLGLLARTLRRARQFRPHPRRRLRSILRPRRGPDLDPPDHWRFGHGDRQPHPQRFIVRHERRAQCRPRLHGHRRFPHRHDHARRGRLSGTAALTITVSDGAATASRTLNLGAFLTQSAKWRQQYFGTTANTGNAADLADPNADGVPNLFEFFLNRNPVAANAASTLPSVANEGANLTITYTRSLASMSELTSTVEWSDTLAAGSWSASGVTETILSNDGAVQKVKASVAAGNGRQRFLRLKVTRN